MDNTTTDAAAGAPRPEEAPLAGAPAPASSQDPTVLTRDVLGRNPRFKKPALKILALVESDGAKGRAEVERMARAAWSASFPETPAVIVDMLVRNKALVDQVTVDGKPYPGSLEDIQLDESVPEEAEVEERLVLTEDGAALLEDYAPRSTLCALFESHPHYADVYRAALWACDSDDGCSRADLEEQIKAMPQLLPDEKTGRTRVYPQYFIDALETAGGIEWDGAWRTTDAGRAAMDA